MLYTKSALEAHADKAAIETAWDPLKPGFYFLTRAAVLDLTATQLQRMQEMRDSKLLVKVLIDLNDAFQGIGLIESVLFVSHRWEDPATPDETGAQLAAIKAHLLAHPEIQFVWFDYSCMPQRSSGLSPDQDDRTPAEKAEFDLMLKAIADLYLTAKVLILLDTMYRTRFWTTMEGWCAMQKVTPQGVRPARAGESRVTVVCIHNATHKDREALLEMSTKTPAEMSKFLASPDVAVTNKKDKVTMLPIVGKTDEHVREMMSGMQIAIPEAHEAELREDDNPMTLFLDSARERVGSILGVSPLVMEREGMGGIAPASEPTPRMEAAGRPKATAKVAPAPPPGLKLEGGSLEGDAAEYMGEYRLDGSNLVNGRPAYQHVTDGSRWLAFDGAIWRGQPEADLGRNRGFLKLPDEAALTPDASAATWLAVTGSGWAAQPQLKCIPCTAPPPPPPPGLKLEGGSLPAAAAEYMGVYRLYRGKLVNGRPAYQHVTDGSRWLVFDGAIWRQMSLVNDEGDVVAFGTSTGFQVTFYCGKHKGMRAIPGSNGHCGPNNGPACQSCSRLLQAFIKSEADLGRNRGFLQLPDAAAATPDASAATWLAETGSGLAAQPQLNCIPCTPPPPPGLKLDGGRLPTAADKYMGGYRLTDGKLVNGRPAYQHTSDATLWIAFDGAIWRGQPEADLGQKRGVLQLPDEAAASPDASSATWLAETCSGLAKKPQLKCTPCTTPPSPGLKLEGGSLEGAAAEYMGEYRLAVDDRVWPFMSMGPHQAGKAGWRRGWRRGPMLVNGRPAWRHTTNFTCWLAFDGANWRGQPEASLGQESGFLLLSDAAAASPDASSATWLAANGPGSAGAAQQQLKCIPCAAPPLSRVELEELPLKNFRGPCADCCKPLAPCCCVSADGEAVFGCVPTDREYFLPACLHMALCPQLGCDPKGGDEDMDCKELCFGNLVTALFVCCLQSKAEGEGVVPVW
jgi:hypothetical protein